MRLNRSVTPSQVKVEFGSANTNPKANDVSLFRSETQCHSLHMTQITSFLYCGSLEAAFNEQLLCRYKIGSLVDVSAQRPNQVARERKGSCPCTCPLTVAHCRAKLIVNIETQDTGDIVPFLKEINSFIHYNRRQRKNVLVYSNAGVNRAPAIIAQYLIQMERHSFAFIFSHMTSLRPQINIEPSLLLLLRKLERKSARKYDAIPLVKNVSDIQKFAIKTSHSNHQLIDKVEKGCAIRNEENLLENQICFTEIHKPVVYAWG